jgi:hypothetical protein
VGSSEADIHVTEEFSASLSAALADREAQQVQEELNEPEPPVEFGADGPASHISSKAYALIVQHETGGRSYYEKVYRGRPIWPGAASGITIGFGYDLGYYPSQTFRTDWAILGEPVVARLVAATRKHGGITRESELRQFVRQFSDISITWDTAEKVFSATTLPVYASKTWNRLPNCGQLPGDCFGVLVSLTFNRGDSYDIPPAKDPNNRYAEMRDIKKAMAESDFPQIPGLIRSMERIWRATTIEVEMIRRREEEAALFQAGLSDVTIASRE